MYKVFVKKKAHGQLSKLPSHLCPKIKGAIDTLSHNPRPINTRKLEGTRNQYRLRIGTYRIVYEINDSAKEIIIHRIKHRKDVY